MTEQGSGEQFEVPAGQAASQGEEDAATRQFDAPPTGESGSQEASFTPDPSLTSGIPSELLDAHGTLAEALKGQARSGTSAASLDVGREGLANVEAVAIGLGEPGDGPPGQPTLNVFVAERTTTDKVREAVVQGLGVQGAGDLPLTVRLSGEFAAQPHTFRIRPAPGGVSVGHYRITAGTLGCLAIGRNAPRNNRLLALSNNHVLANSNNAVFGDSIIHRVDTTAALPPTIRSPSPNGSSRSSSAAPLTTSTAPPGGAGPTGFAVNCLPSGGNYYLFRIGSNPLYPTLGGVVGKTGRTTQLTQGQVVATNWSGWVNYGVGSAYFAGQMVVQSSGNFSAGGDSGSVIWNWVSGLPPVGLLFAGGGGYTIANPMPWVTYFLDINLYT